MSGPGAPTLRLEDVARDELADFVARVVRLDPLAVIRVRGGADGRVTVGAATPFDVPAGHAVAGDFPTDVTVHGRELLAGLAVARDELIDPGTPASGAPRLVLPPDDGWRDAAAVPDGQLAALAERGAVEAGDLGPTVELLDRTELRVPDPDSRPVSIPLRCLLALSGLGLADDHVRVQVSDRDGAWLRLWTRRGSIARPRRTLLPVVLTSSGV